MNLRRKYNNRFQRVFHYTPTVRKIPSRNSNPGLPTPIHMVQDVPDSAISIEKLASWAATTSSFRLQGSFHRRQQGEHQKYFYFKADFMIAIQKPEFEQTARSRVNGDRENVPTPRIKI